MGCYFCEEDKQVLTLVPISPSGQALACIDCAVERNLYCKKHRAPHSGIALSYRNAHACMDCINEKIKFISVTLAQPRKNPAGAELLCCGFKFQHKGNFMN